MKTRLNKILALEEKHEESGKGNYKFDWYKKQGERIADLFSLYYFLYILRPNLEEFCKLNYLKYSLDEMIFEFSKDVEEVIEFDDDNFIFAFKQDLTPHIEHFVKMYFKKVEQYTLKLEL